MNKLQATQIAKANAIISQTRWNEKNKKSLSDFEKSRRSNFQGVPKAFPSVNEDEELENLIESYLKDLWS